MRESPQDQPVRERALDPRGSFLVTAPAGSGKTALLAGRFLRLLAEGGADGGRCHPRRILAVTFTDKAAVEMRERIALWLARARDPAYAPEAPWDARLLGLAKSALRAFEDEPEALANPSSYRISTFHSMCASVASRWPSEAEVPPGAEVLPDQRQEAFLRAAVRETIQELTGPGEDDPGREAFARRLLALNGDAEALAGKLTALLRERHRLGEAWASLSRGDLEGAERAILNRLGQFLTERIEPARAHFLRHAALWRELHGRLEANGGPKAKRLPAEVPGCLAGDALLWVGVADVFLTHGKVRERLSANLGYPKDLPEACKAFIRDTPDGAAAAMAYFQGMKLEEEDPSGLGALFDYLLLAGRALGNLGPRIPGQGLDYLELEMAGLRALGKFEEPSESALFFHESLRHLLVDEAQDLNALQVELLGKLVEGWEPGESEHPRTVFVVGDPKQSIYRFRGSEVSLFLRMAEKGIPRAGEGAFPFARSGGACSVLGLSANFRSHPALVRFCNELFKEVLGGDSGGEFDEVAFERSEAGRPEEGFPPEIRLALFPEDKGGRAAEARWLAAEADLLRSRFPGETIAILIPRRKTLGLYAAAFRERGVPVRMVEGETLAFRPEVIHLDNLLRALACPHDDVAWAGVLRAPWCRVPDRVLAQLAPPPEVAKRALPPAWGRWRGAVLSSAIPEVRSCASRLAPAMDDFGREPLDATLARAWEALDGPRAVAALYGASGVANCLRYLDLVREAGGLAGPEALETLQRLLEKAYTPPDPDAANSQVHLMTIHKAKGLEFDHVFVPYLDYNPLRRDIGLQHPILMLTLPLPGRPAFAAVEGDRRTGRNNLAFEVLSRLEKGRELAELKRLLYVAATRARKGLHLAGVVKAGAEAGHATSAAWAAAKDSPMTLLLEALLEGDRPKDGFEACGLTLAVQAGEPGREFGAPRSKGPPAGRPTPFEPVRLPYVVKSPSEKLDEEQDHAPAPGEDDAREGAGETARAYGVVAHRALESLARGNGLPPARAVGAALAAEGVPGETASGLAGRLLASVRRAWDAPEFARLREGAALHPEWPIEQSEGQDLWVGRLDLVAEKASEVAVVDYKTSSLGKGQSADELKESVRSAYAGQLTRYVDMIAGLPRFKGRAVRAFLLLTELPDHVLVEVTRGQPGEA